VLLQATASVIASGEYIVQPTDLKMQDNLLRVANLLADAARPETLKFFRQPDISTQNKDAGGYDPVTVADKAAEKVMRAILARERPDDGIIGEEFGITSGTSGLTWVLDPIDGTRGYVSGTPTWGILVSVADETGPLLGLIDQPYISERFVGGFGHAFMTGPLGEKQLSTRESRAIGKARLLTTFPEVGTPAEGKAFRAVASQVELTRYGMDCYGYALLAAGQVDLVIEAGLQPYDIHAPIAVITAAGGVVSNWQGGAAHHGGRVLAAANPEIHALALSILQDSIDG
jgi:histidinol phosphatase-like enzyme (inositol monophosphatase family)